MWLSVVSKIGPRVLRVVRQVWNATRPESEGGGQITEDEREDIVGAALLELGAILLDVAHRRL